MTPARASADAVLRSSCACAHVDDRRSSVATSLGDAAASPKSAVPAVLARAWWCLRHRVCDETPWNPWCLSAVAVVSPTAQRVSQGRVSRGGASLEDVNPDLAARIVADSRDRVAWVRARSRGITATDVAALTSERSIARAADAKLMGSGFSGNAYTAHGRLREPEIAAWVAATHGIQPSSALFHAVIEKRHLATPDGIGLDAARPGSALRDQDDEQVVAQHPSFLSAPGVVAAARPRRRAHARRLGGARRLRSRRTTSRAARGSIAMRPRSPSSCAARDRAHR